MIKSGALAVGDDAKAVRACQSGDLAAFETIVRRHQRMLFNVAYRMTGSLDEACDIVQDTFIAAWQKLGDYRGDALLSTWLTAIVLNNARDRREQVRKRERHEAYSLDEPIPGGDGHERPDPPSGEPTALDRLAEEELRRFLHRCIEGLPGEFREVVVLREMQEMAYDQVASALNLREGTVKSRLFRARDALKECMKKAVGAL
jgi:RNA polymerase sigma-70 factor (ECF subfamily)